MMWTGVLLGLIVAVVVSGQQRICMQVENIDNVETASNPLTGIPGMKGEKGDAGTPGRRRGSLGEIDYPRIFTIIEEKFKTFKSAMGWEMTTFQEILKERSRTLETQFEKLLPKIDDKFETIEADMEQKIAPFQEAINERLTALKAKFDALPSTERLNRMVNGSCPVLYNSRCFWTVIHSSSDVNIESSQTLCQETGGNPANIYNRRHMEMIMDEIRQQVPSIRGNTQIWTGLRVLTQNDSVTLYDGSPAPFVKWWRSSFPDSGEVYIYILVRPDPSSVEQGFGNDNDKMKYGVICEM